MKKLRVILPAILTLAVSTSAAVTGTVAWFTASRLRAIAMTGIQVANPESGLELTNVVDIANTKVTGTAQDNNFSVEHLKDTSNGDLVLRDASYDVVNNAVMSANFDETEAITGYANVAAGTGAAKYLDRKGLTYSNMKVVYATQFEATFKSSQNVTAQDTYQYGLFLDINQSTVNVAATEKNAKLNKALRISFKYSTGNEWFVWAPFAEESAVKFVAPTGEDAGKDTNYRATYISYADSTATVANYAEANFAVGNAGVSASDSALTEGANGEIANTTATGYIGYLGELTTTEATVTVTTWFEGTDPNCVANNFSALDDISANLKFVMRRVTKA